jgi:hypothetical protein
VVKKFEFLLTRTAFYVTTGCAIAFSAALQFNRSIELTTVSVDLEIPQGDNQTINYTYYYYTYTDFHYSLASKVIILTTYMIRDLIIGVALVVVNILILVQMKQVTQRRVGLTGGGASTSSLPTNKSVRAAMQAERRKSLMIISTGVNYLLGHVLKIVFIFGFMTDSPITYLDEWWCFNYVASLLLTTSYATPFLFYYFFNIHFRTYANEIIKILFTPLIFFFRRVNVHCE